jgi:hypothetical protein
MLGYIVYSLLMQHLLSVSASVYNMFVQLGTIVYSQIYRDDDKPFCELFSIDCICPLTTNCRQAWKPRPHCHRGHEHLYLRSYVRFSATLA